MNLSTLDLEYLQRCYEIASLSKDPRHKVGCLIIHTWGMCPIVISRGYNRMPRNLIDKERRWMHKETKRQTVIHAEEDAILNAKININGCTLYSNYRPCLSCSRLIIHAGIARVVWDASNPNYPSPAEWFDEAGIEYAWRTQA